MSIMNLTIHGKDYQIACDDGQEAHLGALAQQFNDRLKQISQAAGGRIQENTLLILGALMMADELDELKQQHQGAVEYVTQLEEAQNTGDSSALDAEKLAEHRAGMEAEFASIIETVAQRIEKISSKIDAAA